MNMKRIALLAGITVFFLSVIVFSFTYGPARRSYVSPPRVISVESTAQILHNLEESGVRGRTAICFTRYLNALEGKESKDAKAIELAMNHGIIRRVFHVPPDNSWPEINEALAKRNDMRTTPEGFIGIFDDGRVYIQPLSRFLHLEDTALVVLEPKIWSGDELAQIAGRLHSGNIASDLIVIIRGSEADAETFRRALSH